MGWDDERSIVGVVSTNGQRLVANRRRLSNSSCLRRGLTFCRVRSMNEDEVAKVHHRSESLARDEDGILSVDGVGECDQPSDQTHVPKGNRDTAFGTPLRCDPLHQPAAKKQGLSEEADPEPNCFSGHEVLGGRCSWSVLAAAF